MQVGVHSDAGKFINLPEQEEIKERNKREKEERTEKQEKKRFFLKTTIRKQKLFCRDENFKKIVCFFVLGIMSPINSFADTIGVSLGNTVYHYQEVFGDNLFKKNHPTASVYYQHNFMPNAYAELGIESTFRKIRKERYPVGVMLSGDISLAATQNESKSKVNGIYLTLMGTHDIYDSLSLEGGVGVKYAKSTLQRTADVVGGGIRRFLKTKSTKPILKMSTGLKYKISNKFSLRSLISWENSSRLKPSGTPSNAVAGTTWQHKLKNSLGYSLGFICEI